MNKRQIEMTDLWVRNVRTDSVREEWRDLRQPNLELRVTAKGRKDLATALHAQRWPTQGDKARTVLQ